MENIKESLKIIIARNIQYYRKQLNLTQLELAEKLDYSDKSVSKWERGESVPDVFTLNKIAEFFNITVTDLLSEKTKKIKPNKGKQLKPLLYVLVTWAVFITAYGLLKMFEFSIKGFELWILFIYPIPISALIFLVYNLVWKKLLYIYISLTVFIWTFSLTIQLTLHFIPPYLFYIITSGLYLFFMYLVFYLLQYRKRKK